MSGRKNSNSKLTGFTPIEDYAKGLHYNNENDKIEEVRVLSAGDKQRVEVEESLGSIIYPPITFSDNSNLPTAKVEKVKAERLLSTASPDPEKMYLSSQNLWSEAVVPSVEITHDLYVEKTRLYFRNILINRKEDRIIWLDLFEDSAHVLSEKIKNDSENLSLITDLSLALSSVIYSQYNVMIKPNLDDLQKGCVFNNSLFDKDEIAIIHVNNPIEKKVQPGERSLIEHNFEKAIEIWQNNPELEDRKFSIPLSTTLEKREQDYYKTFINSLNRAINHSITNNKLSEEKVKLIKIIPIFLFEKTLAFSAINKINENIKQESIRELSILEKTDLGENEELVPLSPANVNKVVLDTVICSEEGQNIILYPTKQVSEELQTPTESEQNLTTQTIKEKAITSIQAEQEKDEEKIITEYIEGKNKVAQTKETIIKKYITSLETQKSEFTPKFAYAGIGIKVDVITVDSKRVLQIKEVFSKDFPRFKSKKEDNHHWSEIDEKNNDLEGFNISECFYGGSWRSIEEIIKIGEDKYGVEGGLKEIAEFFHDRQGINFKVTNGRFYRREANDKSVFVTEDCQSKRVKDFLNDESSKIKKEVTGMLYDPLKHGLIGALCDYKLNQATLISTPQSSPNVSYKGLKAQLSRSNSQGNQIP